MRDHVLRFRVVALLFLLSLSLQACSGQQSNGNASPTTPKGPQSPPAYEGYLDIANCDAIMGWGWDMNRPNDQVKLDIYDGNVLVATVTADTFRQDLLGAGKGDGKHSIFWPVPPQMKDGKKHIISLKITGTNLTLETPKEITCNFEK